MPDAESAQMFCSTQDLQALRALGLLPSEFSTDQPVTIPANLPARLFADSQRRQYPCHTKMACFLSYVNRWSTADPPSEEVDRRLEKFAAMWGISSDVERLRRRWNELQAQTQHTEDWNVDDCLQVWIDEQGRRHGHYPVRTPEECVKAARWLLAHRDELNWDLRQDMTERLLQRLEQRFPSARSQLSDEELEALRKQAGRGYPDVAAVTAELRARARKLERLQEYHEFAEPLRKIARELPERLADYGPTDFHSLTRLLDEVDRSCAWQSRYQQDLRRPEEVCYALDPQATRQFLKYAVALSNGCIFGPEILSSLTVDDVLTLGGQDALETLRGGKGQILFQAEKTAEFLEQLSAEEADFLTEQLQSRGVRPVWRVPQPEPRLESWESLTQRCPQLEQICCS